PEPCPQPPGRFARSLGPFPQPAGQFPRFPPLRPGDHRFPEGDERSAGRDGGAPGGDGTAADQGDRVVGAGGPVVGQDRWVIAVGQPAVGEGAPSSADRGPRDRLEVRPVRFRGVARVPSRPVHEGEDTGELPTSQWGPSPPPARVSRYRWRTLRRGARWTMTGVGFAVITWAMWAVTTRDGGMVTRVVALG